MPGNIIDQMPPQDDDPQRRIRDIQRQAREQASAKTGQAMQIGAGGITVTNGGSITIEGSGSLNVGAGALNSAGSISAATTITAGGTISTPANVQGGGLVSTGSMTVAGAGTFGGNVSGAVATFNGGVISTGVYNNLLVSSYRVQYIDAGGNMGYVPSSRRFKQDIQPAPDVKTAMLAMQVVTFRYIEAVEQFGDDAAVEWGVIAEDIDALGLTWAVDYDEEGKPFGIRYERLVLACIPVIVDHEARLKAAGL